MKNLNFELENFINTVNNYENFWDVDEIISYYWEDKETRKDNVKAYIWEWFDSVAWWFLNESEEKTNESLLEYLESDYEQERARGEFADGQIDIYFHDLYKSCGTFADYINECQEEWYFDNKTELYRMIQYWQGRAYEEVNNIIYDLLVKYLKETIEESEED